MFKKIKSLLFQNQNSHQTVAKNAFWLFSGQIGGRLLRTALIIFAARILGPASWGAFSYAMSLAAFLLIFSDIGISAIVTRESAKNPEAGAKYFSTAFFLKLIFIFLGIILVVFGMPYFTKIEEAKPLLPLIAILLIFDSLRNFGFAVSRALEKMEREAFNELLTNALIALLGFLLLLKSPSAASLTSAYISGTAGGFLLTVFSLRHYFKNLLSHFDANLIKPILSSSLPFAFASFLGAIMINTDLIMLSWMRSAEEVGFYSAAQKPVLFLYTLASLFATSAFPLLSKKSEENPAEFRSTLENFLKISLMAAIPMAIGGVIFGKEIISLLFGNEYLPAAGAFKILMATLVIIYPSVLISNSILAYRKQKNFVNFSLLGAVGNIFFNYLLIPPFGIAGCAAATLITQIIANAFIWKKMHSINRFSII